MLDQLRTPSVANRGFTLIELLIAMTVGFIVIATGIAVLSSTIGSNSSTVKMTRLNQDLRGMLAGLSADLRRAGSWALADDVVKAANATDLILSGTSGNITASGVARGGSTPNSAFASPFSAGNLSGLTLVTLLSNAGVSTRYNLSITGRSDDNTLSLTIPSGVTLPTGTIRAGSWAVLNPFNTVTLDNSSGGNFSCILFSYDLDNNGMLDASSERFGYRRVAGSSTLQTTTSDNSCSSGGGWESLSDSNAYSIDAFAITQTPTATATSNMLTVQVREYSATISATLLSDSTVSRSQRSVIEVRNHSVQ